MEWVMNDWIRFISGFGILDLPGAFVLIFACLIVSLLGTLFWFGYSPKSKNHLWLLELIIPFVILGCIISPLIVIGLPVIIGVLAVAIVGALIIMKVGKVVIGIGRLSRFRKIKRMRKNRKSTNKIG